MKNIVAKPIQMGADVGKIVVRGMLAEYNKPAIVAVMSDDEKSPVTRALTPLL